MRFIWVHSSAGKSMVSLGELRALLVMTESRKTRGCVWKNNMRASLAL